MKEEKGCGNPACETCGEGGAGQAIVELLRRALTTQTYEQKRQGVMNIIKEARSKVDGDSRKEYQCLMAEGNVYCQDARQFLELIVNRVGDDVFGVRVEEIRDMETSLLKAVHAYGEAIKLRASF